MGKFAGLALLLLLVSCGSDTPQAASIRQGSIYGSWLVEEIDGDEPAVDMEVTLGPEPALPTPLSELGALQAGGFDGCNGFSGPYVLEGDRMRSGGFIHTLIGCGGKVGRQSEQFKALLKDSTWSIAGDQLTLRGVSGSATLRRANLGPLIGPWLLVSSDNVPAETSVVLTLFPNDRFDLHSGCWMTGDAAISGNLVTFGTPESIVAGTTTALSAAGEPIEPPLQASPFDCPTQGAPDGAVARVLDGATGVLEGRELVVTTESGVIMVFGLPS